MSKPSDKNPVPLSTSPDNSMITDPWESPITIAASFSIAAPTVLNPDAIGKGDKLLLPGMKKYYPELAFAKIPENYLLPKYTSKANPNPIKMLLQNELKLHVSRLEQLGSQIDQALALLYWAATKSEQEATGSL